LALFGQFMDTLVQHHLALGDEVQVERRALWQFDLPEMQSVATQVDRLYFPHRLQSQFPIGASARYFKTTAFPEFLTVDRCGWGASLSWVPVKPEVNDEAWRLYRQLQQRIAANQSVFEQPSASVELPFRDYLLFVCQLPHDETIQFHSSVTVEAALETVLTYAEQSGQPVVVKGHPANRKSMAPLRELTRRFRHALWVEDRSVHTCLAGASRVFLVNSGVGFEAMLHNKTVVHFGRAEYSSVVPLAACEPAALRALESYAHSQEDYVGFLQAFLRRAVRFDDPGTYGRASADGA
jgi:hypothetical protein